MGHLASCPIPELLYSARRVGPVKIGYEEQWHKVPLPVTDSPPVCPRRAVSRSSKELSHALGENPDPGQKRTERALDAGRTCGGGALQNLGRAVAVPLGQTRHTLSRPCALGPCMGRWRNMCPRPPKSQNNGQRTPACPSSRQIGGSTIGRSGGIPHDKLRAEPCIHGGAVTHYRHPLLNVTSHKRRQSRGAAADVWKRKNSFNNSVYSMERVRMQDKTLR